MFSCLWRKQQQTKKYCYHCKSEIEGKLYIKCNRCKYTTYLSCLDKYAKQHNRNTNACPQCNHMTLSIVSDNLYSNKV